MTPYEKHSLQLLTFILSAQNLQLQAMRLSPELSDLVLEHARLCNKMLTQVNSSLEEGGSSPSKGEAASGD